MNIVITGAGKGIGLEITQMLSVHHRVIALSRDISNLKGMNNVIPVSFDIVHDNIDEKIIPEIAETFSVIDILINNAGALINKPLIEMREDDYNFMFDTNIKAPFFLIQKLIPYMNNPSHIVNISSMGGFQGSAKYKGLSLYSSSKGALAILSECMAEELKEKNIRVNCLCLGAVQTEMLQKAFPGYRAKINPKIMATFITDFALNASNVMNGMILPVTSSNP